MHNLHDLNGSFASFMNAAGIIDGIEIPTIPSKYKFYYKSNTGSKMYNF